MASGLWTTYDDTTRQIEERWNVIKDVFPSEDIPVVQDAEKVPGENSVQSWDQENISVPVASNKSIEGADYTYASVSGAKLTNYVQKIVRGDKITMLNQESQHPGIKNREKRTAMLQMNLALMDLEWSMINGTAVQGANGTAAEMGGIKNFVPAAYTTSVAGGTVIDLPSFIAILKKNWDDGARLDRALVNGLQKYQRFDTFAVSGFQRNLEAMDRTNIVTYDKVVTAFGECEIVPHRMVATGEIVAYKKDFVKIKVVRDFKRDEDVARTGDFIPVVILGYYSGYVGNQRAVAKASGYSG